VTETQREVVERKLVAPIVGHVGDGNFHVALMVDTEDAAEMKSVKAFMERLTERAIAMGGTCTGEHGVGQGKMKYLLAEHGAPAMAAMRAVKQALDPDNIMNPGKMLPQA
jgi:D-lactate dehydrogenase (cytochrome)